jgi:hypothetical protein
MAEQNLEEVISYQSIADVFGVNRGSIFYQIQRIKISPMNRGRPKSLPEDAYAMLDFYINDGFAKNNPMTIETLLDLLDYFFDINLKPDTLRHIIRFHPDWKTVDGTPMDSKRLHIDPNVIDEYYNKLEELFELIPAALIINADESGFSEWADSKKVTSVVPSSYSNNKIYMPVKRDSKRCSFLGAITANGRALRPLIILSRKTIEEELLLWGYSRDNFDAQYQENGFISMKLFEYWIQTTLLPYVRETKERMNYSGLSVLIIDGCTAHQSRNLENDLLSEEVLLLFLPAHCSDQIQPLDLLTFAIMKAKTTHKNHTYAISNQTRDIMSLMDGWRSATTPHKVIGAWRRAGVQTKLVDGQVRCEVNRSLATNVRHWQTGIDLEETRVKGSHRIKMIPEIAYSHRFDPN